MHPITDLNKQLPCTHGGKQILQLYTTIREHLAKNFSEQTADVLAKPEVQGNQVSWTELNDHEWRSFDQLTNEEKQNAGQRLTEILGPVIHHADKLSKSYQPDASNWGMVLLTAFKSDHIIAYWNGQAIKLMWGQKFYQGSQYRDFISFAPSANPSNVTSHLASRKHSDRFPRRYRPAIFGAYDTIESIWKKAWWILLPLLILLFYLMWKYRDCPCANDHLPAQDLTEQLQKILPPREGRHAPVDTTKIIDAPDSIGKIISDLLNIALKDRRDLFDQMMVDLKAAYPDSAYKIIYYNRESARIQLQVPDSLRNSLKTEIKQKLGQYSLLIWDEAVFEMQRSFNDPSFNNQGVYYHFGLTHTPQAWDITAGDTSVTIAIIDDGFDLSHPDLQGNVVNPYNVLEQNNHIYAGIGNEHGTHVAGLALARSNNQFGTTGIAPGCRFMPIQIYDGTEFFTSSIIIDAILYALRKGAKVVNLSLGEGIAAYFRGAPQSVVDDYIQHNRKDEEAFWQELFLYADSVEASIVMAAGNESGPAGLAPMSRPRSIILVASVDKNKNISSFSNSGDACDISAPGSDIMSLMPGGGMQIMSGTSMSSPIVAGAIGLMKCVNPHLKNDEISAILKSTAMPLAEPRIGGLIDIQKAVNAAKSRKI